MKKIEKQIKKLFNRKQLFCEQNGHSLNNLKRKINNIDKSIERINTFLKPLKLKVKIIKIK